LRFGYAFLAIQLCISAPWLTWAWIRHDIAPARYAFGMGLLLALSAAFVVSVCRSAVLCENAHKPVNSSVRRITTDSAL
jgi:hypothetical protein